MPDRKTGRQVDRKTEKTHAESEVLPTISPKNLAELWNELKADNQPSLNLSTFKAGSVRWRAAQARLKDCPDLVHWRSVIERIAKSGFCSGENDRGWKADFDFLVRQETHIKASEGKYDDKKADKPLQFHRTPTIKGS